MQVHGIDENYYVFLTPEETDVFFDAYDPVDQSIPTYLVHQGYRHIKSFIYSWLQENVGDEGRCMWSSSPYGWNTRVFVFHESEHAVAFKIFWDGYRPD